jgi:hypothetical protein
VINVKTSIGLAAGLAAVVLAAHAQGSEAENMHLKIRNQASEAVTVSILKGGDVQKQQTVRAGERHRFKFEWCAGCCGHDKERGFQVKQNGKLLASGTLDMNTRKVVTGSQGDTTCVETNTMTVTDQDEADAWVFSQSSENSHRTAVLTVEN